jgi:hypothetical protein
VNSFQYLSNAIRENSGSVVGVLNDLGIYHVSPCTDAGFKYALNDGGRAIRFIGAFCELLDARNNHSCEMFDGNKILEKRSISIFERIPESIGKKGDVIVNKTINKSGANKGNLPNHPKIDSGFIIKWQYTSNGDAAPSNGIFKVGIEMQVQDEGNMSSRGDDYGTRIFRYKGENGEMGSNCKVFELLLNRWGLINSPHKLLSVSSKEGGACDSNVCADLVDKTCVCCVSLFLGKATNIMGKILNILKRNHSDMNGPQSLKDEDKREAHGAVSLAMREERNILSRQVHTLISGPDANISNFDYSQLVDKEKHIVDRIGFFKYGHLMSEADVAALSDDKLKEDYKCIKIQEEDVMNKNIDQVSAIWGEVAPYNTNIAQTVYATSLKQQATLAQQQATLGKVVESLKGLVVQLGARAPASAVDTLKEAIGSDEVETLLANREIEQINQ